MRVVIAPDSFGGTLTARAAAEAMAAGWREARPDDELTVVPLADGGEGTLDVLARLGGQVQAVEVAGPHGKPVVARWLRWQGVGYIESAEACGLRQLPEGQRNPLRTTTYGVGQLMTAACAAGVDRIVVGLGGSATVDGGAGALTALGMRLLRQNGNGLKVGGGELHHLRGISRRWLSDAWRDLPVVCWADARASLLDAPSRFGPQKGATRDDVELLRRGLAQLAYVVERDLGIEESEREAPWTGSAGGLGYGLLAGLGAEIVPGAQAVAELAGLGAAMDGADLVVTGEGALDSTSMDGKVVGHVVELAREVGIEARGVVGRVLEHVPLDVVEAAPIGPGPDPAEEVTVATYRLAARLG